MSDIERRSSSRLTRRQREQRAFQLLMASGVLGVIAVVGIVLAAVGVLGFGWPVIVAILAIVSYLMFRRTVGGG